MKCESCTLLAQNLVKNPSFENYNQCPNGFGLFNSYIQDWFGFTGTNTSSYFNACAPLPDRVPENRFGFQYAKTGNAYACILVKSWDFDPNGRAYIEGGLISLLKKDTIYCIRYFVSTCDISRGVIKNVDAFISDTLLDWNNGFGNLLMGVLPQIKSTQLLNDTANWMQVNGLYKAHGGEQYITIGNFLSDAQTTIQSFNPGNPIRIDYYIDDVSVTPTSLIAPNLGNDTTICKNALPYILTAPLGYDSYQWNNGGTGNILLANDSGVYWVRCILAGCGELSDTVRLNFKNSPQLNLGNDTILCIGNSINLTAQPGFNSYLWNTNAISQSTTVSDSGLYIVQATDFCGIQLDSIHVLLDSLPNIGIDLEMDSTICNNGLNIPIVLSTNAVLPNYNWSNGATTSQLTVTKKGWYWLQCIYRCGTIKSDSIFIDECPQDSIIGFYVPNAFTPNNDGKNDVFKPEIYNGEILDFKIFNRWGNVVFSGVETHAWNGTYNGKSCPADIYVYVVSYQLNNKKSETIVGKVLLFR